MPDHEKALCSLFDTNPKLLYNNLQVIACAGAGKTEFVSRRIAYLIYKDIAKPENIVAFTFTERAAEEQMETLKKSTIKSVQNYIKL